MFVHTIPCNLAVFLKELSLELMSSLKMTCSIIFPNVTLPSLQVIPIAQLSLFNILKVSLL